jgi:hypothetical protein
MVVLMRFPCSSKQHKRLSYRLVPTAPHVMLHFGGEPAAEGRFGTAVMSRNSLSNNAQRGEEEWADYLSRASARPGNVTQDDI